jgi:hypothetical protein
MRVVAQCLALGANGNLRISVVGSHKLKRISMTKFDEMFDRLNQEAPSRELQIAVGEVIAETLEQIENSLGYWEKFCILQSISAFSSNLGDGRNISDIWLRLSLTSAEKALVPKDQRNESYGRRDDKVEALTYQQLAEVLQQLRAKL